MNDFDLRKYLSNNPLHQSNIGGFSITELQQTTKSDFEIGLAILNEIGYDFSEELLTESKIGDFIKSVGSNIKTKISGLVKNIKTKSDAKKELEVVLADLKLNFPKEYKKITNYLKSGKKLTAKDLPSILGQLDERLFTRKDSAEERASSNARGALLGLALYLIPLVGGAFLNTNDVSSTIDSVDNSTKTELVQTSNSTDLSSAVDYNVYKTQHQKGESDIDDKEGEAKELIKALGIDKMSKGTKAKLGVKGKISSTLGDQDDNPNGPKKKGLGQDRLDQGKEVLDIAKEIAADEYGVDIDIEDQGTNVKDALADKSNELDADSKEALSGQTTDYTLLDVDTGDTGGDDVDDTDADKGDISFPPPDALWFANKRPESVKTKYEVVFMQILPSLIGDGEPEFYKNDEFQEILKYVGAIEGEKQSFNEKFIKDRIDPDGVLQQALKDPKYKDVKDKIQNTINVLDWVKFSTKNPSTLENLFKKLDPNIKLGDRKANKALPGKAGQAAKQPGTKSTPSGKSFDTNLRETVLNEIKSILFEKYDIQNLSTFNKKAATDNLGLLVPLYSDTWGLASDEGVTGIEYDAEYLGDKYKNSLNKLKTIFPKVKTVVGTSVKLKDKETTQPTKTGDITKSFLNKNPNPTDSKQTTDSEQTTDTTQPKDKKEKEHAKSSRLAAIEKEIESKKSLQTILSLVDQSQEIDPFIFGLLALINDKFENDKNKLRNIIQGTLNKFNQEVSKSKKLKSSKKKKGGTKIGGFNYGEKADIKEDIKKPNSQVIKALEAIKTNPIIGPRLDQLINPEEAINLITDVFFDLDDPELKIFKNASSDEIKQGLERALKLFQSDPEIKKSFQNPTGKDDQEIGLDVFYKGYTSNSSDYKVKEALIKEGLSEDESKAVLDKYKQRYAAVLKSNPDFIKKYPNPDKVIYGMAIKEITKLREKKLTAAEKKKKEDIIMSMKDQKGGKNKLKPADYAAATATAIKVAEGDLDVGHQDDEPRMIKKDIYNMGKYAMEIYKKLDQYDDMDNEVDFPHWWQSKITKAKSMLQSAYDYLDGEEKITQIDAIMEEEEKLPVNDIKKAIRALLKKEGGAAGLAPILKLAKDFDGVTQIDVEDILDNGMKDVEKHRDGDYILKEEEVKIGPHTFKKIKDDHYHKIDKNRNEKTGRKFRQQEIDYLMKTLKETGQETSKENMKGYKEKNKSRLEELVKAALMGPISEKMDPVGQEDDDINNDGKVDKTDKYLKNKRKAISKNIKEDNVEEGATTSKINQIFQMVKKLGLNSKEAEAKFLEGLLDAFPYMGKDKKFQDMAKSITSESFKSLSKDIDKQKGKTKEDGDNIAGYIANIKRTGGGKGPTAKQKKRMAEYILKELRK